jgi:hypothetical protein
VHLLDTRTIFLLHFCNIYAHLDLPAIVEAKGPATDEIHAFDTILRIRLNHASQVCWTTTHPGRDLQGRSGRSRQKSQSQNYRPTQLQLSPSVSLLNVALICIVIFAEDDATASCECL